MYSSKRQARIADVVADVVNAFVKAVGGEGWIACDFDGTLARHTGDMSLGAPVPAMVDKVKKWIADGKKVKVFTARAAVDGHSPKEVKAEKRKIHAWCQQYIGQKLPVTAEKDPNMIAVYDDRAVAVQPNTGKVLGGKVVKAVSEAISAPLLGKAMEFGPPPKEESKRNHPYVNTLNFAGLKIAVENRKGDIRHGKDGGEKKMHATYGGIIGKRGPDGSGDRLDCFVGKHEDAPNAFLVTHKRGGGEDDDVKTMLGYKSEKKAKKAYLKHFDADKFGGIEAVPMADLKSRVDSGGTMELNKAVAENTGSVMVAYMVPEEIGKQLHPPDMEDREPTADLHITLAYLGKVSNIADKRDAVRKAVAKCARKSEAVNGQISGVGRFVTEEADGKDAWYASFDSAAIGELRDRLVERLAKADAPAYNNHGFTPHITLAYLDKDKPTPDWMPPKLDVKISRISIMWGSEREDYLIGAPTLLRTSVQKAICKAFDEAAHPRVPAGKSEGGEFTSVENQADPSINKLIRSIKTHMRAHPVQEISVRVGDLTAYSNGEPGRNNGIGYIRHTSLGDQEVKSSEMFLNQSLQGKLESQIGQDNIERLARHSVAMDSGRKRVPEWAEAHTKLKNELAELLTSYPTVYVRQGRIGRGQASFNKRENKFEAGASVFAGKAYNGKIYVLDRHAALWFIPDHICDGDVLEGLTGGDNEPLMHVTRCEKAPKGKIVLIKALGQSVYMGWDGTEENRPKNGPEYYDRDVSAADRAAHLVAQHRVCRECLTSNGDHAGSHCKRCGAPLTMRKAVRPWWVDEGEDWKAEPKTPLPKYVSTKIKEGRNSVFSHENPRRDANKSAAIHEWRVVKRTPMPGGGESVHVARHTHEGLGEPKRTGPVHEMLRKAIGPSAAIRKAIQLNLATGESKGRASGEPRRSIRSSGQSPILPLARVASAVQGVKGLRHTGTSGLDQVGSKRAWLHTFDAKKPGKAASKLKEGLKASGHTIGDEHTVVKIGGPSAGVTHSFTARSGSTTHAFNIVKPSRTPSIDMSGIGRGIRRIGGAARRIATSVGHALNPPAPTIDPNAVAPLHAAAANAGAVHYSTTPGRRGSAAVHYNAKAPQRAATRIAASLAASGHSVSAIRQSRVVHQGRQRNMYSVHAVGPNGGPQHSVSVFRV